MGLKTITPATTYPITVSEAKEHCYITIDDDDTLIQSMIETATELCQNYIGQQIKVATFEQSEQEWDNFSLLKNPLGSLSTIKYYDENDTLQTLSHNDFFYIDDYQLPNRLVMKIDADFPTLSNRVNPILITYTSEMSVIHGPILAWIKIQVATFYKHREEFTSFQSYEIGNRYVDRLLDNYKVRYV